jgi:hypothetical protein
LLENGLPKDCSEPGGPTESMANCSLNSCLNIEIASALAERECGRQRVDVIAKCSDTGGCNHLQEAGHDVIAIVLVRGCEPVFEQHGRPIGPAGYASVKRGFLAVRAAASRPKSRPGAGPTVARLQLRPG